MQAGQLGGSAGYSDVKPREAASRYDTMLRSDPNLARATWEALVAAHDQHDLWIQGRLLCSTLRPRFITSDFRDRMAEIGGILASVMERAGRYLLQTDSRLDLVDASEQERAIWAIDPGYEGFTLTSRLDSFATDKGPRFVEYNAESPAGIAFCDLLAEIFGELPAMQRWRGDATLEPSDGRGHLTDTLLWAYKEWGGSDLPSIAIIDWDDVITKRDFELCASYFRSRGLTTIITDPRSLEHRSGKLWCGEQHISLVYRRVLLHELLAKEAEVQPLLTAYREGAVCMVNSPRSKLLHKKTIFALLSDRGLGLELSAEEEAVIEGTVPWTRRAVDGSTTFGGQTVDLARLLLDQQERFTVKPADDYGGRGVVLGWDTPRDAWEEALERAFGNGYIVQERVDVPEERYPVWRDGALTDVPLLYDTNPLLFRGSLGCILTRLSGSALLNVTAGTGSTTATFILNEEG